MNFIAEHAWFVNGVLVIFLLALVLLLIFLAMKLVGGHVRDFFDYLLLERDEFKKGEKSIGALNWRCVRLLFVFGVLLIIVDHFTELLTDLLAKTFGVDQAQLFHKSVDVASLFFVLALVVVTSVLVVYGDAKRRR